MSSVHGVSYITNILSGIIQKPILQDVSVHGEVSVDSDDPSGVFWLKHGGNKIRCFVPDGNISQFSSLLTAENMVVVNGKITLFTRFSQYQIRVSNIQNTQVSKNTVSVTKVTNEISCLVAKTEQLQDIRIQGEILAVHPAGVSNWDICDVGGPPELRIKCVHLRPGPISPLWQVGNNNVCVRGNVSIYPSQSQYQIDVTGIGRITENNTEQCQCPGCAQCGNVPQCNRPRNSQHELCSKCYAISPDNEKRVEETVDAYFSALNVNGFSSKTQHEIQMGSDNRKPDVVLVDGDGSLLAIAECKGAGFIGDGIDQLKSYLSATDTRFGIFANRADPKHWEFYENRRRNRFDPINRSEFELGVVNGITTRERLKDEIGCLNGKIIELENQISELDTTVDQITQTKCNLTEHTSNLKREIGELETYKSELHEEIHRELDDLLEEKMQRLEKPLSDMKIELQKRGIVNWFKNLFSKENK